MKLNYISFNLICRNGKSTQSNERRIPRVKGKVAFNADGSLKL